VYDQPDIAAHAHRPEICISCFVEFMKLHARIRGIQLQIERSGLDGLLFLIGQFCKAVGKCVGDADSIISLNCLDNSSRRL
jgi:hypothetical protein